MNQTIDEQWYTCPMHPEIVRNHPGCCPKCGMALEPRDVPVKDSENQELADIKYRLSHDRRKEGL